MVATKKTKECQSTDDPTKSKAVLSAVRPRKSTKGKQRPTYRRRAKPPHTYAELITMAIKSSPSCKMTLREILVHMSTSYECFRGSYVGWKNSVRHNLSANDCFVKVLRNSQRPYGKDNFWTVVASCTHCLSEPSVLSPDHQPSSGSSPLHHPCQPRTSSSSWPADDGSSHHSEKAAAPYLSTAYHTAGAGQLTASVPRCQSPTPGSTPETGAAPVSGYHYQACDEWSQLEDLFVPDADIDLALYNEEFKYAIPHQPSAQSPIYFGSAGQNPSSVAHVKSDYHPSYPEYLQSYPGYLPEDFAPYQPRHSLFPCCRAPVPYSPPSEPLLHEDSYAAAKPGPDQHHLGSIVVSAIRGSLNLDLDESALQAIERSVRLLDRHRPDDLIA